MFVSDFFPELQKNINSLETDGHSKWVEVIDRATMQVPVTAISL